MRIKWQNNDRDKLLSTLHELSMLFQESSNHQLSDISVVSLCFIVRPRQII